MAKSKLVPAPESVKDALQMSTFGRESVPLFNKTSEGTFAASIAKAAGRSIAATSRGITTGLKPHPFDMSRMAQFLLSNEHHSTCINTKVESTVGLGFVTEESKARRKSGDTSIYPIEESKVDKILNELCDESWSNVLTPVAEDFHTRGGGLIEVKRSEPRQDADIVGLHPIPAASARIYVEDTSGNRHWQINGSDGDEKHFPRFGDMDEFFDRNKGLSEENRKNVSEVIYIPDPTILSRWYGYPRWLAAVAAIELNQCLMQERYDFYLNRGVPEFMLFVLGAKLPTEDWEKIEAAIRANIGLGNGHKSMALNLEQKDMTIQVEKLRSDTQENEFMGMGDTLSMKIVSAHRVPPLLAGIAIPGKMGAANELTNALVAFQTLVIGPVQRRFRQALTTTLGNPLLNGGLQLTGEDFTFNQITDQFNMGQMDTIARMRETIVDAKQNGRDLSDGLKD